VHLARYFKLFLLALSLLHLVAWGAATVGRLQASRNLLLADSTPVAGDFINMHAAGGLALAGDIPTIYDPQAFMAYERSIIPKDIGLRLWAYPPHSLLFLWPFGLVSFYAGLAIWSLLGLIVLGLGARRLGFDGIETTIIVLSPAALQCLHFGQTGNFFTGLLLLALAAKRPGDGISAVSAALLTMKPQTGFLLALLWLVQARWRLILLTTGLTAGLVALTLLLFSTDPWRDYLGMTLPLLSELERHGSGGFMRLMPSVFMALRILGVPGDPALYLHLGFAAIVLVVLALGLRRARDSLAQSAMLLLGTALTTPYLHSYDLAMVMCGALLVARRKEQFPAAGHVAIMFAAVLGWGLPNLIPELNARGAPVSPLIILALFAFALAAARR
jgi:alpha-1,2-mannosyltransferase